MKKILIVASIFISFIVIFLLVSHNSTISKEQAIQIAQNYSADYSDFQVEYYVNGSWIVTFSFKDNLNDSPSKKSGHMAIHAKTGEITEILHDE